MFTSNPFAELPASIPPAITQAYIIVMVVLVVAGTCSTSSTEERQVFLRQLAPGEEQGIETGRRRGAGVPGGPDPLRGGADVRGVLHARRRIAHLLTMYGFLAYVITTAVMVFGYPTPATPAPAILPSLWHIGA